MLGLCQEVGSDGGGVRGGIGDDHELARARQAIEADLSVEVALGRGHIAVARSGQDVHGRPQRSEGEGCDGLCAPDGDHGIDAGHGRSRERCTRRTRGCEPHPLDPGDPGGDRGHEHRRRQGIAPSWRVGAGARDREPAVARPSAGDRHVERSEAVALGLREGADPSGRALEEGPLVGSQRGERLVQERRTQYERRAGSEAVEALCVPPQSRLPALSDVLDDPAGDGRGLGIPRGGTLRLQLLGGDTA